MKSLLSTSLKVKRPQKHLYISFFLLVTILLNASIAQQNYWTKTYNPFNINESSYDVCLTSDSCFILVGSSAVAIKIDRFGDTLWNKRFSDYYSTIYCCASSPDGGCIFSGEASQNAATRIDRNGNIVWHRTFPGSVDRNTAMISDASLNYVMTGNSAKATKFDSLGNLIWNRSLSTGIVSVLNTNDNGYLFVGSISDGIGDTSNLYLAKTDRFGNLIWERRHSVFPLGVNTQGGDQFGKGFVVGGSTADTNGVFQSVIWFAIISELGDLVYSKSIYTNSQEYFADIEECSKNRFVLVSRIGLISNNAKATIYDISGIQIVSKIWESNNFNSFRSVISVPGSNLLFAGRWQSVVYSDIFASLTDSMLNTKPLIVMNFNKDAEVNSVELFQNFPNPFNNSTTIAFSIRKQGHVLLEIFDLSGRIARTFINETKDEGLYKVNISDLDLPSGCYLCRIVFDKRISISKRIMLLK